MENSKISTAITKRGNVQINFNVTDSGVAKHSADGYHSYRNIRGPVTKVRLTVSKPSTKRGLYAIHRETWVDGTDYAILSEEPWNVGESKFTRSCLGYYNTYSELDDAVIKKFQRVCKDFKLEYYKMDAIEVVFTVFEKLAK